MKENILVIGGTGKTGRKVAEKLKDLGHNVRIGSRTGKPSFDWNDSKTWSKALQGMDKVYITFQPDLAVPGALEAIEELVNQVKKSSIKKMVLLSGKGEREAELCEQVIIHSGVDYTIVRASWFNQNFSESFFLEPILEGFVALPQAEEKVPYVDTDDIADVVVETMVNHKHNGKIHQLTGPRALTFKEVIQDIATATGRDIAFTPIALTAYKDIMEQQGVPSDFIWLIEYLFSEVLGNPNNSEVTNDVEKVLGRKPKDFSEYIKDNARLGVWNPNF